MILGFTGTQQGMEVAQRSAFHTVLEELNKSSAITEFHHGDCLGADAEAHSIVRNILPSARIHIHPPDKDSKRRFCEGDVMYGPHPYLERNQLIVDAADILVATPKAKEEVTRSGTWTTVRRARDAYKSVILIYPDGSWDIKHRQVLPDYEWDKVELSRTRYKDGHKC